MKNNNEFAVFIMVHGRPDKMWTYKTLRKSGYSGKIYLVADDLDETVDDYKKKYKDELIIFDKKKAALKMQTGDNTGDLRSTLFSSNTIFELAKQRDIKYFFIMCDDYTGFEYRYNQDLIYGGWSVKSLDKIFDSLLHYYKSINCLSIAFAQSGDFMGGKKSSFAKQIKMKRKAMNTFLCSTNRPFKFIGRMNEDVSTYVNLGSKGGLFLTIPNISIYQKPTTKEAGGLTDLYLEYGTYVKSFFSVMFNPSSVKISMLGYTKRRIHHRVSWNNAIPKILNEKHKK
tara:strand:- start:29 stop:883 length:855 start_codon:yes stop_codon:yes gene_type:complete